MLWVPVMLGIGIGGYFLLPYEPAMYQAGKGVTLALIGAYLSRRWIRPLFPVFIILLVIGVGFATAYLHARYSHTPVIQDDLGVIWVRAEVERLDVQPHGVRLYLKKLDLWQPERGRFAAHYTPKRARVSVRTAMEDIHPGDYVQFRAILHPPPAKPVYPGGYDFARYAYFEGIGAVGYSISPVELREADTSFSTAAWRHGVTRRILAYFTEGSLTGNIAAALLTGQRGGIDKEVLEAMRQAGLGHLLAISGLHLALVMAGSYFIMRAGLALVPWLALRYPIKQWSAVVALVVGAVYLMLTGAPVSAQRAYIMAGLFFLAIVLHHTGTPMRPVALAACIILFMTPEALVTPSFQMSFAAVIALVATFQVVTVFQKSGVHSRSLLQRISYYLGALVLSSLVAGMATAPFAIYHFGRYASYGLLANLIAIPLTSLWIMPWGMLALLLMPIGLEGLALIPMGWGLDYLIDYAGWIAALPGASVMVPQVSPWSIVWFSLAGLWLCLWRRKWRIWALPMLFLTPLWFAFPLTSPDVIIDEEGKLFAVRDDTNGKLVFSSLVHGRYAREQWLRYYAQAEAMHYRDSKILQCDEQQCHYQQHDNMVVFVKHIPELCPEGEVVVTLYAGGGCSGKKLTITLEGLRREGTHILHLQDGLKLQTVQQKRGKRLWTVGD